jgi:RNA polymerase sigma-70 factor (sigma-E family)
MTTLAVRPGWFTALVRMVIGEATAMGYPVADNLDRDALVAELFDQEATSLVRLARLFTDDRSAAEDLVQEAFIRLHRSAHRLEDLSKAPPYLRSIVINLARDHNRRGLMSLRHIDAHPVPMLERRPDDLVIEDEARSAIVSAMRELAPRQRDCLLLRFYLDLSESETADVLGISPNSVKTHCRRALANLRVRLEESDDV